MKLKYKGLKCYYPEEIWKRAKQLNSLECKKDFTIPVNLYWYEDQVNWEMITDGLRRKYMILAIEEYNKKTCFCSIDCEKTDEGVFTCLCDCHKGLFTNL